MGIFKDMIEAVRQGYREADERQKAKELAKPPKHPSPGACHRCLVRISFDATHCLICSTQKWPGEETCFTQVRVIRDDFGFEIACRPTTLADVKTAKSELKLISSAITNLKREIMEDKRQTRADYTHSIRRPRLFDARNDLKRARLASQLSPYEEQHRVVEQLRIAVRDAVARVDLIRLTLK